MAGTLRNDALLTSKEGARHANHPSITHLPCMITQPRGLRPETFQACSDHEGVCECMSWPSESCTDAIDFSDTLAGLQWAGGSATQSRVAM